MAYLFLVKLRMICSWIDEIQNTDKILELEYVLDKGEASAIALALETENSQLIIDEKKGRKVAQSLNIEIMGTLRLIQMAKQKGIIESTRAVIEDLQRAGFRFSPKIVKILLNNELNRALTSSKHHGCKTSEMQYQYIQASDMKLGRKLYQSRHIPSPNRQTSTALHFPNKRS